MSDVSMEDLDSLYRLAESKADAGEFADAALLYQRIAHADIPKQRKPPFHLLAADAFLEGGRKDDALVECEKAVDLVQNELTLRSLGRVLIESDRTVEAEEALTRSIEIKATPTACVYLGVLLIEKNMPSSEAHFRKAIQLDPGFDEAYVHLGRCLAKQGRRNEAIEAFRRAIELDPNYLEAHREIGIQLASENRGGEAMAHLRKYLADNPHDEAVVEALAKIGSSTK